MKKKNVSWLVVVIISSLFSNAIAGDKPDVSWSQGAIVLANQQVLTGNISVQDGFDLILFKGENKEVMVYPAHKLRSFQFYDKEDAINRKFISQCCFTTNGFVMYHFYEVVVQGEISVIRKQKVTGFVSDAFGFDYYVVNGDETFDLQQFYRKVYPTVQAVCGEELRRYMKKEHLNPRLPSDAIRIVMFFNRTCASGGN